MTNNELVRLLERKGFTLLKRGSRHDLYIRNETIITMSKGAKVTLSRSALHTALQAIKKAEAEEQAIEQKRRADRAPRPITRGEVRINRRVQSLRNFVDVPAGTPGTIIADYGPGITVQWQTNHLPPITDGFCKSNELCFLALV